MERLTEKNYKAGDGYYMGCRLFSCEECERFGEEVDRLGQIEDILGDTYDLDRLREAIDKKDEYERFMKQWEQMAEIAGAVKKVSAERVAELVEADKAGRRVCGGAGMRLIDADSIKYHRTTECGGHGVFLDVDMVYKEEIDAIPTIGPESLRPHGTWEGTADGYANGELAYDTWTCSECGYTVDTDDPDDLTKFCPNCGAKMEGGHNP